MPKTHGGLWERVTDWDCLYGAYKAAAAGKRYKPEVMRFRRRLEENITNIQNHLLWRTWRPSPYRHFVVNDRKQRHIMAPPFVDRVVHHAIVSVIEPLFDKKFIFDSYACRPGKGNHAAAFRVQSFLRKARAAWGDQVYVLQADISKFFPSVPAETIKRSVRRTLRETRLLNVIDRIADHGSSGGIGMPVGALTSQLFANITLDRLDHLAKDEMGIKLYVRYMDDWVVIGPDKAALWRIIAEMEQVLSAELGLFLNRKTDVYPAASGVDFCGYRIWDTHILPRKCNIRRAKRNFAQASKLYSKNLASRRDCEAKLASFIGYIKHCSGQRTRQETIKHLALKKETNH